MITMERTRKEEIVSHAAHLFREKGFKASTMRDIAHAVGMEAASLYNHVNGKQQLLETICHDIADQHIRNLSIAAEKSEQAVKQLECLVRLHIRVNLGKPEMSAVTEEEWKHLDDVPRTYFLQQRNRYESAFQELIDQAKEEGAIKNLHSRLILHTLLSSLQWLHHWYRKDRPVSPKAVEDEIVEMVFNGINK